MLKPGKMKKIINGDCKGGKMIISLLMVIGIGMIVFGVGAFILIELDDVFGDSNQDGKQ